MRSKEHITSVYYIMLWGKVIRGKGVGRDWQRSAEKGNEGNLFIFPVHLLLFQQRPSVTGLKTSAPGKLTAMYTAHCDYVCVCVCVCLCV